MSFLGHNQESSADQTQITATDRGLASISRSNVTISEGGGIALAPSARYAAPGSIQSAGALSLGNITASGLNSRVDIGLSGEEVSELVGRVVTASERQINATLESANAQQAALIGQVGTLAENSQTGENKTKNNTLALLAAAAIVGLVWIARKRL